MTNEFEAICSLVRGCGEIIRSADRGNIQIDEKSGPADFKLPPFGFSILRIERIHTGYAPELDD